MLRKTRSLESTSVSHESVTLKFWNSAWSPLTSSLPAVTVAPAAGRKTTRDADVFDESVVMCWSPYEPPATSTVWPGWATWYARSNDAHGDDCVHAFVSEPFFDTNTDALPPDGHALVVTLMLAW